ncbi:MAG: hypothetical protein IJA62_05565 [Ruminococcus sp.]|nr:hypothetical protein [Ruminococcus sp.]
MAKDSCEMCAHYVYDFYAGCYTCEINLDEDEMEKFLRGSNFDCHYYEPDDEYKIVRKQN